MTKALGKYQFDEPLSDDQFAALEADILDRGLIHPIEVDEQGNVLDGHHRKVICDKHGIEYEPKIVAGLTEQQKREYGRRNNNARRHYTREQRRRHILREIETDPDASDREIARRVGVDHKTVGKYRREVSGIPSGEIPRSEGLNGMPSNGEIPRSGDLNGMRASGEIPRAEGRKAIQVTFDAELSLLVAQVRRLAERYPNRADDIAPTVQAIMESLRDADE